MLGCTFYRGVQHHGIQAQPEVILPYPQARVLNGYGVTDAGPFILLYLTCIGVNRAEINTARRTSVVGYRTHISKHPSIVLVSSVAQSFIYSKRC
jgi:hypothetical protein